MTPHPAHRIGPCDHDTPAGVEFALKVAETCGCCGRADCPHERHVRDQNRLDAIDQRGELTPELDMQLWLSWSAERITRTFCEGTDMCIDLDLSTGKPRSRALHSALWKAALRLITAASRRTRLGTHR